MIIQNDVTKRPDRDELLAAPPGGKAIRYDGHLAFGASLIVEQYRLHNGLRVLLMVDRAAPVVAYHTWFRVGSRHEHDGKTGIAHLLEHLMFGEFEGLAAGEFDRRLEECGAENNAATWVDWTFYHEQAPADQLDVLIELESKRMGQIVLRPKAVESEIEVVANERRFRVEDDVDGAASETLYATAFTCHGYRIPTIGWMADIKGFVPEDCAAFYRTYYAPNNATLVIVGDINEVEVLRKIATAYGYLESQEIPVEDSHPEPPQVQEKVQELAKPTETDKLNVGYHAPALGDFDHPALSLLVDVFTGGRASRLYQVMQKEMEIATDARGFLGSFRDPGLLEFQVALRPGKTAEEALKVLDEQIALICENGVDQDELERAKARAELGLLSGMETASGKAEQIAFFDTVLGDPCGAFNRLEALQKVTRSDMLRVARRYLTSSSRTVVIVHPQEGVEATETDSADDEQEDA